VSTSIKAEGLAVCCSGAFRCLCTRCQGGKEGSKAVSKQLGSPSFYRENDYSQVENVLDSCQSSQEWTSRQGHPKVKKPRATSQTLQASVSMLKVKVHDRTIRKRLNKDGLFGRAAGESLFSLKRTWQHSLGLQSCI